jgi:DNA-binding response OmpR family regulator
MNPTVLIVEDEDDVVDLVRYHLSKAGFEVLIAKDGPTGLQMAISRRPDVVVLDLMLPGLDGHEICRTIKADEQTAHTGVLMLTAKGGTKDRVRGLELGADDYVPKPFSPRELVLRVQALQRRVENSNNTSALAIDAFSLDKNHMEICLDGKRLDLTTTEYKLLSLLLERRGRTLSRDTLLFDVWGYQNMIDTRTVDTHMRRLREKLGAHSRRIETIRGEGYRFAALPLSPS